jgi:hypothetical protein
VHEAAQRSAALDRRETELAVREAELNRLKAELAHAQRDMNFGADLEQRAISSRNVSESSRTASPPSRARKA